MKRCTKLLGVLLAVLMLAGLLPLSVSAATLKITTQPKTSYTAFGETAKATVQATGDGLTYQWYIKNAGATKYTKSSVTKATYSTKMSDASSGRSVYCVVKDKKGKTVKSSTAILRMKATITTQPKTSYAKLNATVKTTVKAAGDGLTYTWYIKNAGATKYTKSSVKSATYATTMTSASKNRLVYCVVKDKWGKTATTGKVYLREAASVTTQPKTVYAKLNSTIKTTVKASGDGLTYTWYIKAANGKSFSKSSITSATYTTTMTSASKNRQVYCVVKDKYGKTVQTNTVYLRESVSIITQPKNAYANLNATVKTTVKASGDGLTYTWYFKNAGGRKYSKSSVTSATYATTMTSASKNRQVYCVVKDKYGKTVQSNTVTLKQSANPLTISNQPQNVVASVGDEVGFGIVATGGTKPYTYQWQYTDNKMGEWANVPDKAVIVTGDMVSTVLTASEVAFNNEFRVRCIVTDAAGNQVISDVAWIERQVADLEITMQPSPVEAAVGDEVGFGIVVEGGYAPYTYEWQAINNTITEWTKIDVEMVKEGNMVTALVPVESIVFDTQFVFRCVVTDAKGNQVISDEVWIEEKEEAAPLTIDWQTSDLAVHVGDYLEFAVGVSGGTEPYTYRWQYLCDGMDMWQDCGVESDTFALTTQSTHFDNHYQYRCVITDAEGEEVMSEPMRPVEILSPFVIVTQPQNVTAQAFDRVSFSVEVQGGKAPYTYEWQYIRDGLGWTTIVGDWADGMGTATISFGIDDSEFTYHYKYRCVITDANGNVMYSDAAWVVQG